MRTRCASWTSQRLRARATAGTALSLGLQNILLISREAGFSKDSPLWVSFQGQGTKAPKTSVSPLSTPSGYLFGASVSVNALSREDSGGLSIRVPETRRMVGA